MNVFGAFTFGSLIKTFLPGFVWLIALVLLEADAAQLLGAQPFLWGYTQREDQAALVLAIPVSILLGLLSNIAVFMGVNDLLVRMPVRRAKPELFALYDALAQRVRSKYWDSLDGVDPKFKEVFDSHVDPEYVLLQTIGVEKLAYVREQYWYHLEFQLNLLLSVAAMAVALIFSSIFNAPSATLRVVFVLLCLGFAATAIGALVAAARKNYARHIAKVATLMAAVLCAKDPQNGSGGCNLLPRCLARALRCSLSWHSYPRRGGGPRI